jgi:hypothetical protein
MSQITPHSALQFFQPSISRSRNRFKSFLPLSASPDTKILFSIIVQKFRDPVRLLATLCFGHHLFSASVFSEPSLPLSFFARSRLPFFCFPTTQFTKIKIEYKQSSFLLLLIFKMWPRVASRSNIQDAPKTWLCLLGSSSGSFLDMLNDDVILCIAENGLDAATLAKCTMANARLRQVCSADCVWKKKLVNDYGADWQSM